MANDTIGKLGARIRTGCDEIDYDRQRASDLYSRAVDERPKAESDHCCEVVAWKKRVEDLESKLSAAVDAEAHNCECNDELGFHVAGENNRRSHVTDARARVVATMNGLGAGLSCIFAWINRISGKLQRNLPFLIKASRRAA